MKYKIHDGLSFPAVFTTSPQEKIFELSLVISFLMHLFVFVGLFYANTHYSKRVQKNLEVIYQAQFKAIQPAKTAKVKAVRTITAAKERSAPNILEKRDSAIPAQFKELSKEPAKFEAQKKTLTSIPLWEGKRQVSIPMLDSEKISSPRYMDYHERIRTKIKNRAYLYVDNPQFEKGEVYLTFVLSCDGKLKEIKILDDRTSANDYLKKVGLRSIQESSPFPPFPKELVYPELSFNVVISFEVSH